MASAIVGTYVDGTELVITSQQEDLVGKHDFLCKQVGEDLGIEGREGEVPRGNTGRDRRNHQGTGSSQG